MDFVHEPSGDQLFNEIKQITVELHDLVFHLQVEFSLCVWTGCADGRRDVSSGGLWLGGFTNLGLSYVNPRDSREDLKH